jgi:RNA polymerase sigma factor (sigma-70 family)
VGVEYGDVEDAELLGAAARGDQAAFAVFYLRWLPQVVGYHLRRTHDRELAFDLTAETFAAVVAGCGRFDPARGSAPGWLFEIAAHKLGDSVRRARVESSARRRLRLDPVVVEDVDLERVQELASLADSERLMALLAGLPESQRVAVERRVLEERSYPEIAGELRCSEAATRGVVPNGVASVTLKYRTRQGQTNNYNGNVVNNVFAIYVAGHDARISPLTMIWRSPSGYVIRMIPEKAPIHLTTRRTARARMSHRLARGVLE